jgi:hypothetical protein
MEVPVIVDVRKRPGEVPIRCRIKDSTGGSAKKSNNCFTTR